LKRDINIPEVEGVSLAVIRKPIEFTDEFEWFVYLINQNPFPLYNIMVTSRGYGQKDGEEQKTSTLRQMIDELEPNTWASLERITPDVFHLANEYWISYYLNKVSGSIYDKKFVFMPGSICEENLKTIAFLGETGVLHV